MERMLSAKHVGANAYPQAFNAKGLIAILKLFCSNWKRNGIKFSLFVDCAIVVFLILEKWTP